MHFVITKGDRHGSDRMVVEFTTTYAISAYHRWSCEFESHSGEVYSIERYEINLVSDLRQVGDLHRFHPSRELTATI